LTAAIEPQFAVATGPTSPVIAQMSSEETEQTSPAAIEQTSAAATGTGGAPDIVRTPPGGIGPRQTAIARAAIDPLPASRRVESATTARRRRFSAAATVGLRVAVVGVAADAVAAVVAVGVDDRTR
jgi:hypothetical protein